MLQSVLCVGAGSALGGMARYLLSMTVDRWAAHSVLLRQTPGWVYVLPFGTLAVNITGCFVLGLLNGWCERHGAMPQPLRLFLTTGLCGGFTTFSTFAYEDWALLRTGELSGAWLLYALATFILGLGAVFLATRIAAN